MSDDGPGRSRDFERFLTFVDAVVAIALTLLVLPLVDVATDLRPGGSVHDLMADHLGEIVSFALSFAVIGRLWFYQHRVMRDVVGHDRAATRFTVLWLFFIVLLPFPTSLVAQAGDQPTTKIAYVGTMALSTLSLAGVCWALGRRPEVRGSEPPPRTADALATTGFFVLALVVMLLVPWLSYWPLLLLLLDDRVVRAWDARRGRRARRDSDGS